MNNYKETVELLKDITNKYETSIKMHCITTKKLNEYTDLEEQGRLIKLPCKVGDAVYIIEICENIDEQLDGDYKTATGFYCPYEDCCPHDTDYCEIYKNKEAVFEDTVKQIFIGEEDLLYIFENCHGKYLNEFGKTVFLNREDAEKALKGEKLNAKN